MTIHACNQRLPICVQTVKGVNVMGRPQGVIEKAGSRQVGERCLGSGCARRVGTHNKHGYCVECECARNKAIRAALWTTCAVDGCDNRLKRDNQAGFCQIHKTLKNRLPVRHCADPECWSTLSPHNKTGYCSPHWGRQRMGDIRKRARRFGDAPELVIRSEVWVRDGGTCYLCGEPAPERGWHLDHVVPLARGGHHSTDNVRVTCPPCNMRKGDRVAVLKPIHA